MGNVLRDETVEVGKLDIHYLTGGQGEPLVIVHGGGDSSTAWLRNAVEFSRHYRVYVPDLPGFGRSQPLSGDTVLPGFVSFMDDFSRSLGLESLNLVGHSLGGGIALQYALAFPHKVKRLVLVSSICLGTEIALWARFLSHPVLCKPIGEATLPAMKIVKWLARALHAPIGLINPLPHVGVGMKIAKSIMTLKGQTIVLLDRLPELLMPTLLVWGSKDGIVPATHCYAASELIPDCRMHVFEGCGHSVYRQRIDEFSRVVTSFLG